MINFSIHSLNSHLFNVFVNQKHIYKGIVISIGIGRYLSSGIGIVSAGKKWYRGIPTRSTMKGEWTKRNCKSQCENVCTFFQKETCEEDWQRAKKMDVDQVFCA